MIDPEHQRLLGNLDRLLASWEAIRRRLLEDAACDKVQGLKHTAEVNEMSAMAVKGCLNGLKDVIKEDQEWRTYTQS